MDREKFIFPLTVYAFNFVEDSDSNFLSCANQLQVFLSSEIIYFRPLIPFVFFLVLSSTFPGLCGTVWPTLKCYTPTLSIPQGVCENSLF